MRPLAEEAHMLRPFPMGVVQAVGARVAAIENHDLLTLRRYLRLHNWQSCAPSVQLHQVLYPQVDAIELAPGTLRSRPCKAPETRMMAWNYLQVVGIDKVLGRDPETS
jgi:hypothetical protein